MPHKANAGRRHHIGFDAETGRIVASLLTDRLEAGHR
jgi:hypothetical protein